MQDSLRQEALDKLSFRLSVLHSVKEEEICQSGSKIQVNTAHGKTLKWTRVINDLKNLPFTKSLAPSLRYNRKLLIKILTKIKKHIRNNKTLYVEFDIDGINFINEWTVEELIASVCAYWS